MSLNLNDERIESNDMGASLPPGKYPVLIEKVEDKVTKKGNGNYYSVQYRIVGNKYKNKCLFNIYNYRNPNETAQNIGLAQLKELALAAGLTTEQLNKFEPNMLINKNVTLQTALKNDPQYGEREIVQRHYKFETPSNVMNEQFNIKSDSSMSGDNIPF